VLDGLVTAALAVAVLVVGVVVELVVVRRGHLGFPLSSDRQG
jgi:hypothetical protein